MKYMLQSDIISDYGASGLHFEGSPFSKAFFNSLAILSLISVISYSSLALDLFLIFLNRLSF